MKMILTILGFLLVLPGMASATDYYVDATNGNDDWNGLYPDPQGGSNGPWKFVPGMSSSTNSLSPEDVVYLKKGEIWTERLWLKYNGTSEKRITFTTKDGFGSDSDPNPKLSRGVEFDCVDSCNYNTLENLIITDTGEQVIYPHHSRVNGLQFKGCEIYGADKMAFRWDCGWFSELLFEECFFHDNDYEGIYLGAGVCDSGMSINVSNCSFVGNCEDISDIGTRNCDQLTVGGGADIIIEYSYFKATENSADGNNIDVLGRTNIIRYNWLDGGNNFIYTNLKFLSKDDREIYIYGNVIFGSLNGIRIGPRPDGNGPRAYIYNNVIANNENLGIMIQTSDTTEIKNNILYDNGGGTWNTQLLIQPRYSYQSDPLNTFVSDNNVIKAETGQFLVQKRTYDNSEIITYTWDEWQDYDHDNDGNPDFDQNSVSEDPLFVDYSGLDFHLQEISPAINKGAVLDPEFSLDHDGNTLGLDGFWDIGAFEYQAEPVTCQSLLGTCCQAGETCLGTLQPTSDCDTCCIGTCQPVATCQNQGYRCCESCLPGTEQPAYDSDCTDQLCCSYCDAASLVNSATMTANSEDFAPASPVENLWDGCTDLLECAAGGTMPMYWVEFDFGSKHNLTNARLFGDAWGAWVSRNWSLYYRAHDSDPWASAFEGADAFMNDWSEQELPGIIARYARVEVHGNPDAPATNAGELEIHGIPVFHRADTSRDGCIEEHELIPFIDLWKYDSTAYPMSEMMGAVVLYYSPGTWCS